MFAEIGFALEFQYPYKAFVDRDPLNSLINNRGEITIKRPTEMGDLLLQGILYAEEGNTAIINNELLKEGDILEGYTIKKIESRRVIFEKDGKEYILKWEG